MTVPRLNGAGPPPPAAPGAEDDLVVSASGGGTSQRDRGPAALDPSYVLVDEQDTAALLRRASAQARLLRFDDGSATGTGAGTAAGTWDGFLPGDAATLAGLAGAAADPASLPDEAAGLLARPHLALFLAFLRMLGRARDEVNTVGSRHLDFFYRSVLGLTNRPAQPDSVAVILALETGADPVDIPAGTLLDAGTDDEQLDRRYSTDSDIVVTHAQIAELRSLHLVETVTMLADLGVDGRRESVVSMLRLALGDPTDPVRALPPLAGRPVDLDRLLELAKLVGQASDVHLSLPDLRQLIGLVRRRRAADTTGTPLALVPDAVAWPRITQILAEVGARQAGHDVGQLDDSPNAWPQNLQQALGLVDYDVLPQVLGFDDLYPLIGQQEVQQFVTGAPVRDPSDGGLRGLGFTLDEFLLMEGLRRASDGDWAEVDDILTAARRAVDPTFDLAAGTGFDRRAFEANAAAALILPDTDGGGSLDPLPYWANLEELEAWFGMSIESVDFLLQRTVAGPDERDFEVFRTLLLQAYRTKTAAMAGDRLDTARSQAGPGQTAQLTAVVRVVLADRVGRGASLTAMLELLPPAALRQLLPLAAAAQRDELTDADWAAVRTTLLGILQGAATTAVPVWRQWGWLSPLADATSALRPAVGGLGAGTPRWATFGAPDTSAGMPPPPPVIGFAICSPTLALSGGPRTVSLTLTVTGLTDVEAARLDAELSELQSELVVEVSSATGWIRPAFTVAFVEVAPAPQPPGQSAPASPPVQSLQVTIEIPADSPAVAAVADDPAPWPDPAVRLLLAPVLDATTGTWTTPHEALLAKMQVLAVHLAVEVALPVLTKGKDGPPTPSGPPLPGLAVAGDTGPLDAGQPFEPFGAAPVPGSRLTVTHPELSAKQLTGLALRLTWLGAPADLQSGYYARYDADSSGTRDFVGTVQLARGRRVVAGKASLPLFADVVSEPVDLAVDLPGDPGPTTAGADASVRLVLEEPDFGHHQYPVVASRTAMAFAAALTTASRTSDGTAPDPAQFVVNPPYTPKLQSVAVGYTASATLDLSAGPAVSTRDRLWHIHPFGRSALPLTEGVVDLLPGYDNAGELYIGLTDVVAPESVTLLFQVGEGSADPNLPRPRVDWSYLSGEAWQPLDAGQVIADGTGSLQHSGIVHLALPATTPSTLMPEGRYWLRAAVADGAGAVADMIGVHSQAVSSTYVDNGSTSHYAQPLPAGTVTGLLTPNRAIASVTQPYSSSGGGAGESDGTFRIRVSERLRHRGRAAAIWDYEHLVLEHFPDVSRAKCLPVDDGPPGAVDLVVLPDVRHRFPFNPFEPQVSADRLTDIAQFLAGRVPAAAQVRVRNADFLAVRVRVNVRFLPGYDERFYVQQLRTDLDRFLSPWAFDDAADIVIGGSVWVGSLVAFVDDRAYVDHVDGLELLVKDERSSFWLPLRTSATVQAPDTVMVSAGDHEIVVLADEVDVGESWIGIGFMAVERDFVVG